MKHSYRTRYVRTFTGDGGPPEEVATRLRRRILFFFLLFLALRRKGLSAFRSSIVEVNPEFASRVQELATLDHLRHWSRPGLLCIGDEAHAMSLVASI